MGRQTAWQRKRRLITTAVSLKGEAFYRRLNRRGCLNLPRGGLPKKAEPERMPYPPKGRP